MPYNIVRLPLDITGTNVNNLIIDEPHTLSNRPVRAIATNYGPFFAESLIVKENSNTLTRGLDYQIVELHQEATLRYGKEIASVILIINSNVGSNVTVTYQALGGHYAHDNVSIANAYQSVINDNRPISWNNIFNKPTEFNPVIHRHLLEDIFGFEPIVDVLERIKRAITLGQAELLLEILNTILNKRFAFIRSKFDPSLTRPIRLDDLLYYLTSKKIISKISAEAEKDEFNKGNSITFTVNTQSYPVNQLLYWEVITNDETILSSVINRQGTLITNNSNVYISVYFHTGYGVDENKDIYLVIKNDLDDIDYLAITYRARLLPAITTTDYSCFFMNEYFIDGVFHDLSDNYTSEESLDEYRIFFLLT